MGSSNTNVPLYPSLEKRGKGRFSQDNFKIPLYPLCQRGIKTPVTEGIPDLKCSQGDAYGQDVWQGYFVNIFLVLVIKTGLTKLSQTYFYSMAGGRGVEPRFAESESGVLPLNDPPFLNAEFGLRISELMPKIYHQKMNRSIFDFLFKCIHNVPKGNFFLNFILHIPQDSSPPFQFFLPQDENISSLEFISPSHLALQALPFIIQLRSNSLEVESIDDLVRLVNSLSSQRSDEEVRKLDKFSILWQ